MSKWEMVKLGEVCEILDSQRIPITANERVAGIYPYYGANGVQDYVDDYIFDDELVLVAEDGGHFGSKSKPIAYRVSGKCWVNNHAHVLKAKEMLDIDYLCYSLMFYDVSSIINGATRQKLNQSALRQMKIPLPSLEEQRAISAELDTISTLITKRKHQLQQLDTLVKSKFVEMFGDPVTNPMGWEVKKLGEISRKITDGKHGGCKISNSTTGYYFIGAREVFDGKINYENAPQIEYEEFIKDYKRCNVENNDFIIVNTGATIGKSAILNHEYTCHTLLQKSVALIKTRIDSLNPNYLRLCYAINTALYHVEGASAQPNLLLSKIRDTAIPLPPIELQNEFAEFVAKIEKTKREFKKGLEKFEKLYHARMNEYFG